MGIKEHKEKRAKLAKRIREMADAFNNNGEAWKDAAEEKNWAELNKDYDETVQQIEKFEQARLVAQRAAEADALEREIEGIAGDAGADPGAGPGGGNRSLSRDAIEELRTFAFAGWIQNQLDQPISQQNQQAAERLGWNLNSRSLQLQYLQTRDLKQLQARFNAVHGSRRHEILNAPLTTTTGSSGGNIIPPETLLRQLEVNMLAFGSVLQAADIITTSSGEPLSWPTADDTGNKGRRIAESTAADDNAGGGSSGDGGPNPTFAKVTWNAYKYTSDTILVPFELLQDSAFELASILGAMLGERLGRILEEELTTADGSSKPQGIVTGSSLGVTAAATGAITTDEVYQLQHSIDPAYRMGGAFMLNDAIVLHLRQKKDSEGRYIWQSGFNTGVPDTSAGSPMFLNQEMAGLGAGNKTMLFGQLSKYKVRRVGAERLYRMQERYRERDQDGFVAFLRADGGVLDAGTPPIKHLIQAAS